MKINKHNHHRRWSLNVVRILGQSVEQDVLQRLIIDFVLEVLTADLGFLDYFFCNKSNNSN